MNARSREVLAITLILALTACGIWGQPGTNHASNDSRRPQSH